MSPTPRHNDENHRFDPRSEAFLASLRNLIEFKVTRQNFNENRFEVCSVFSRIMVDALEYAASELEGDGWYLESITRIWDDRFFAILAGDIVEDDMEDGDGFVTMMKRLFSDSMPDDSLEE
ncbi:MAG: hypothetical protein FJ308_23365 [Planctomycetes bacterium]|nr:hypothetical protein [Planctomycetota bacterium]